MHDTGGEYRPVSRLAVAALVAGGLSVLALVSPLAWVLPLLAFGLALAALADVGRAEAPKAGGWAAVAGLALAAGFGAQAVSGAVAARWLVERRATATARHWVEAVRAGRLADAIAACEPRVLPGAGGPRLPSAPAAPAAEEAFAALPAVRAVAACGVSAGPRIEAVEESDREDEGWVVRATLAPCGRPGESLRITVAPQRVARQHGPVERWLVTGFALER